MNNTGYGSDNGPFHESLDDPLLILGCHVVQILQLWLYIPRWEIVILVLRFQSPFNGKNESSSMNVLKGPQLTHKCYNIAQNKLTLGAGVREEKSCERGEVSNEAGGRRLPRLNSSRDRQHRHCTGHRRRFNVSNRRSRTKTIASPRLSYCRRFSAKNPRFSLLQRDFKLWNKGLFCSFRG